jgi:hypothetical protein
MNKRGLALSQIIILLSSVIAFSFILNIKTVVAFSAKNAKVGTKIGTWEKTVDGWASEKFPDSRFSDEDFQKSYDSLFKKGVTAGAQNLPASATLPTSAHGYAGKAVDWVIGDVSGQKGTVWDSNAKKWVDATAGQTGQSGGGYSVGGILQGAAWAAAVAGAIQFVAPLFGANSAQTNAISAALGLGTFTGTTVNSVFGKGGYWQNAITEGGLAKGWSIAGGASVAALIFFSTYKSTDTETIQFNCDPWQAPTGGSNCEKCNKGILPCSEYQCRSLGQSCQLLNQGTAEEQCAWVNRNDVNPPVIKPWNDALLSGYTYNPDNAISPPDKGVKITNTATKEKCAEAFTPLTFGLTTNEPAQCKISDKRLSSFEEMNVYFGNKNAFLYNHTQVMSLPGEDALNASGLVLENDGNFEVYVRCQDSNGNSNTANFVFKYCVEKGPDTTAPLIVSTSLLNGMPISYGQTSADINVYTNEPATCKWDFLDKNYADMDNAMSCSQNIFQLNSQMLYTCATTLAGLKNEFDNKFYFRCQDSKGNANAESYQFTLKGTKPLVIDSVSPNDTIISDATDVIQVTLEAKTSAGYKLGESNCYYSDIDSVDNYVLFYNTNSYAHSQELWLGEGSYTYYVKCIDLGGNTDEKTLSFKVETDSLSPIVVRAYHEGSLLKILTNEEAECVYDTTSCSYDFDDGIKMASSNSLSHTTSWDSETSFYIKCEDEYGNQPLPDKCNIIAKPTEGY